MLGQEPLEEREVMSPGLRPGTTALLLIMAPTEPETSSFKSSIGQLTEDK